MTRNQVDVGLEHHRAGRLEEAERIYRAVLQAEPDNSLALHLLGVLAHQAGRNEAALELTERALAIRPGFSEALANRALFLQELKRFDEALAGYDQTLTIKPDYVEALNNRGNVLQALGRHEEAVASYDAALSIKPGYADALHNRGTALMILGRHGEALKSYDRALVLAPERAETAFTRGVALQELKRYQDACASFDRALAARPDHLEARVLRAHMRQHLCSWSETESEVAALRRSVSLDQSGKVLPLVFLSLPGTTAGEQLACARQFVAAAQSAYLSRPPLCAVAPRSTRQTLRVAYLSSDYYEHPVSYLIAEVIERHDRTRFEVIGYSYGRPDNSPIRKRLEAAFDEFHDIRKLSAQEAARQIAGREIDLLVDLNGHTAGSRTEINAQRPAPVQVNWLGYPGTLGLDRIADYIIGDSIVTPLEHAPHYGETLALLPHCYQPNDRQRKVKRPPSRKEAGLPSEGFVFCSFNQSFKITPAAFGLWCRLLRAVPGSLLWLLEPSPAARENLRREAKARRIAANRLVFARRLPLAEHLSRLQLADLALDTFPYTSHTTASDVLWAGVPLVTWIGDTFASRVAASIVGAAGIPELVTQNAEACYALALELAAKPRRLKAVKAKLARNRLKCPLFDSARFTRNLERAYDRMWENHRAGSRQPIVVGDS